MAFAGCTTLSTNNGVAVPNGLFESDARTPLASFKMWFPSAALGLVTSIGGTTKLSNSVPDSCLFAQGRQEFITKTSGKDIDIRVVNYVIYVNVIAYSRR
jgi:hypothetical protein